jgi:hypothetical protein
MRPVHRLHHLHGAASLNPIPDVFILWHTQCTVGEMFARTILTWLRLQVFYRSLPSPEAPANGLPHPCPTIPDQRWNRSPKPGTAQQRANHPCVDRRKQAGGYRGGAVAVRGYRAGAVAVRGGRYGYGGYGAYRGYRYGAGAAAVGAAAVGAAAAGAYYRGGCGYDAYGNWVCPPY